jgi:aminopeptidase N
LNAYGAVLKDTSIDNNLKVSLLTLPEDSYLAQLENVVDTKAFFAAREFLEKSISEKYSAELLAEYQKYHGKNTQGITPADFANRKWKNTALAYLSHSAPGASLAYKQFTDAQIMTDQYAALAILSHLNADYRKQSLEQFHQQWKNESLVLNKWFAVQALSTHPDTFEDVVKLWQHPDFNFKNPNRVYALLLRFGSNFVRFHDASKDTYSFMTDKIIEIDKINPQVASRVATVFDIWPKLPTPQKAKVQKQLDRLLSVPLSNNTFEIISRAAKAEKENK